MIWRISDDARTFALIYFAMLMNSILKIIQKRLMIDQQDIACKTSRQDCNDDKRKTKRKMSLIPTR
jgi:septum formation topological specificity factor MinE